MKTCEAINSQEDFSAEIITTDFDRESASFCERMGIHRPFDITCLGVTDTSSPRSGRSWQELIMLIKANFYLSKYLFLRRREFDIVYFRDESLFIAAIMSRFCLRKKFFFEIHSVLSRWYRQMMNVLSVRFAGGVLAISTGLKRYYEAHNSNILVSLCSAAEDSWFDYSKNKDTFRKELGLPLDAFLVGYIGVVGINPNNDYYELDDILRSLAFLPKEIKYVVAGELNNNADWLRKIASDLDVLDRIIILPWLERKDVPKYLQAFDINLIPKRKKDLVGDSPAKMFPALASLRPIVAGHAECIEEVLTDGLDAIIVEDNKPEGWAGAIVKIYENKELAHRISSKAFETKHKYTWEKRGIAISEFIRKTITTR
ncbi:MAG: glycosyltransferase [Candidatus Vogelbacteria bacterium]|nr:glycosyltransferase [Candidatus Vogelbacteria bacterium]